MKPSFSKALFTLITICLFHQSFAQDTLHWRKDYQLSWADFKGEPSSTSPNLAISSTGIVYSFRFTDTAYTCQVNAFLDRNKSWKKPLADNSILKHEQGHFDITEIFARKLDAAISSITPSKKTIKKTVAQLAEKIILQKNDFQKKYDTATNFGTNKEAQLHWEIMIKTELEF